MAENRKMSTAEILAAARAAKAAKSEAVEATALVDAISVAVPTAAAPKPAAVKSAGATSGRPSVAEIMALARAKKEAEQGGVGAVSADLPMPKATAAKVPVAKVTADKPAVAMPTAPKSLTRDTASILAAARTGVKPGPVSKVNAPARPAAVAEPASTVAKALPAKLATALVLPPKPVKLAVKKGADTEQDRRGFLDMVLGSFMATGFTALSITGGLFGLGLARFMFPNVLAEPPSRFKVGSREGFPSGKVETKYVAQYGVWVVNSDIGGQQQIYALKTVCTHLGCTPNWLEAEQKFKCPCHGSGFYKDGVNFEGPAPRPLERYAIRIADDGQLEIDKGRSYHEELGQWADPESFITV